MYNYHGEVNLSSVYYKIYKSKRKGLMTVVCLQDFDEYDYDQTMFVVDNQGNQHVFETEDMAISKLNEWYKPNEIDPEYLISSKDSFLIRY